VSKPRSWRDFQYSQARREVEALARAIPLAIGDVESPQSGTRRTERTSGGDVSDPTFAAALSRNKVRDDARNLRLRSKSASSAILQSARTPLIRWHESTVCRITVGRVIRPFGLATRVDSRPARRHRRLPACLPTSYVRCMVLNAS
jgi:hypothetical protein